MSNLEGKVVVITGASGGIGAALAEAVAKRGGSVALLARREAELEKVRARCGERALVAVCDVTKRADVERARDAALARFGHVDCWVNNAGRGITRMPSQLTDEDIDAMVLANLKSVMYGIQAILPHFRERKEGHILNVSTMLARLPFAPIRSAYAAAKAAVNSLSSSLRVELRDALPNVHVTVVHPGVVETDFGLNALHGGPDNRKLPGAQPVEEVANVIADTIEKPRGDVYTRKGMLETVAAYYSAEDMGEAERKPPFVR
jgi:NAD(P)-dependent dehydrogenase (short-subunit alcohol dehydrogenase family)